jgi:hypothetical protein
MALSEAEWKRISKDITNKVYLEDLKFKGHIEEIVRTVGYLNKSMVKNENLSSNNFLRLEKLEKSFASLEHTLAIIEALCFVSYEKSKDGKAVHDYLFKKEAAPSAPKDWYNQVRKYSEANRENDVARLITTEDERPIPAKHGQKWEENEDRGLNDSLAHFLQRAALKNQRTPSAIAFRVIRQLKIMGIELV